MSPCPGCPAVRRSRLTIKRLNGGVWPADIADWRQVYRRAGITLRFAPATDPTFLVGETAFIAIDRNRATVRYRLCHEMVEYLTRTDEHGPEMRVCLHLTGHDVARSTECLVGEPSDTCDCPRRTNETQARLPRSCQPEPP